MKKEINNLLLFSSLIFFTNVVLAYYKKDYIYIFLFSGLIITSLLYHSNNNIYTNILDKIFILGVVSYGGYSLYNKSNEKNQELVILIILLFLSVVFIFYYGYCIDNFCYHPALHVIVGVQIKTDFKTGDRTSQVVKFNCNSTVLDFSPYKDDLNFRFEHTPNLFDYNRFTKVKKIIIGLDVLTIIPHGSHGGQNIFNKSEFYSLYTVEELVILCDCLDNFDINDYSESKFYSLYDITGGPYLKGPIMHNGRTKLKDMITYAHYISGMHLPNLKKISFIKSKVISFTHIPCAGGSLPFIPITIEEPNSDTGLYAGYPKLKHIVFQNLKFYPKRESDKVKIEFI